MLSLAACNVSPPTPTLTPRSVVTPSKTAGPGVPPPNPRPTQATAPSVGSALTNTPRPTATHIPTPTSPPWEILAPGLAVRHIPVLVDGIPALVYAVRIDPGRVDFRVHWDSETAHTVEEWQALTGAWLVVNGGFFTGGNAPVGRLIIDGEMFGSQEIYSDSISVGGLFAVVDGEVTLRALGRGPYGPNAMRYDQAVECYPMLLLPGRQPTYPVDTGEQARRTVIALDEDGHVVILLSDLPVFTLYGLSRWLARSDLRLDTALNLDGGRSSGMVVKAPGSPESVFPAYVPLPIVIAVYPRE